MHDLFNALDRHARKHPEKTAFEDDTKRLGYGALASEVTALARLLPPGAHSVGIAGLAGLEWIVADLATTLTGRRVIPLPPFFSPAQTRHLCVDAGVDLLLLCGEREPPGVPPEIPRLPVTLGRAGGGLRMPRYAGGAERVIYTSGTTGAPKGVVHGDRQLSHAMNALASASGATEVDRHCSALPYALLLEQIAGIFLPVLVGGYAFVSARAIGSAIAGDCSQLLSGLKLSQATSTVLVPQLLPGLLATLTAQGGKAPASLRLAALGGAPVAPSLLKKARAHGFPLRYGYGLSEACSVVSIQEEGAEDDGSVGRPLPGVRVTVEDGEIVVAGEGVMQGYLGHPPLSIPRHPTGDTGWVDAEGRLWISGRKDRVMVLSNGRNLSPEWIEAAALVDPLFAAAQASGHGQLRPRLMLVVRPQALGRLHEATPDSLHRRIAACFVDLPAYARPEEVELRYDPNGPSMMTLRFEPAENLRARAAS
jgi:long-subunit acyl-CoA synthetase (AMP-forming)